MLLTEIEILSKGSTQFRNSFLSLKAKLGYTLEDNPVNGICEI